MILKIVEFLNTHPGYVKKGANKLRQILAKKGIYTSNEEVLEAQRKYRELSRKLNLKSNVSGTKELQDILSQNGIKSVWTMPNGEIGWSIRPTENKKNEELQNFKDSFLKDIRELGSKKENKQDYSSGTCLLEISLPDFHFGKIDGLTIEEQAQKFYDSVHSLYNRSLGYQVERVLLPIGNDFFNTDNINYTTTKGTPQRDNSHWQESFRVGWKTVIETINYLEAKLPVDIVIVQGNHDFEKTFYLGEVLEAYYANNKNVYIMNNTNSPRKYYKYGEILLGFTHGDKEKPHDLPLLMAKEAKELWAETSHHEWHIGHLHKHMHNEYQGVAVKTLPSLVGQDEWHKLMGYTSTKKAQAYIWNREDGLEGYIQININE